MYPTYELQLLHAGEWVRIEVAGTPARHEDMKRHLTISREAHPREQYRIVRHSHLANGPVEVVA